ncbi:hypothetical protein L0Z72_01005, partial [candidate division KSB1 bacterium]|nr:hypothetical protein [candidate division KSB1 bacterium]
MKMLFISPVLLIAFICIIFILIYLYKTSELINKRKLGFLIVFFAVLFIIGNLLYFVQNKEPEQKFRLTIYPFQAADHLSQFIPDVISKQLSRLVNDQALIIPVEWTAPVVNKDSVADQKYLARLSRRLKATHFLTGTIAQKDEKSWLIFQ